MLIQVLLSGHRVRSSHSFISVEGGGDDGGGGGGDGVVVVVVVMVI